MIYLKYLMCIWYVESNTWKRTLFTLVLAVSSPLLEDITSPVIWKTFVLCFMYYVLYYVIIEPIFGLCITLPVISKNIIIYQTKNHFASDLKNQISFAQLSFFSQKSISWFDLLRFYWRDFETSFRDEVCTIEGGRKIMRFAL